MLTFKNKTNRRRTGRELTANRAYMQCVILAGGLGSRLSEETVNRPKPMVEIGGRPMLWHIMKIYAHHGVTDFVICLGYKGYQIKEFFANYVLHESDVTIDLSTNAMTFHSKASEPWKVTLVDTGNETMTGGRLKRAAPFITGTFCLTYGDGVSDIDIADLIRHHKREGRTATITAVRPPGRFGALAIQGQRVTHFEEKPRGDGGWINGGFMVCEQAALDLVHDDATVLETGPLAELARSNQLSAYMHEGFWQPMDTLRDRNHLNDLWAGGRPPWKVWSDL